MLFHTDFIDQTFDLILLLIKLYCYIDKPNTEIYIYILNRSCNLKEITFLCSHVIDFYLSIYSLLPVLVLTIHLRILLY